MSRLPCAENIAAVVKHLGFEKVHLAARLDTDWTRYAALHGESIASLVLVCPSVGFDAEAVRELAPRLMVIADDQSTGQRDRDTANSLSDATLITLADYSALLWSDVVADRPAEIESAITEFTGRFPLEPAELTSGVGEVNGVTFHVEGSGPPLVLLPLVLAPSQWEPIIANLRRRFTVITLGSVHVGFVPVLESRAQTGYLDTVKSVVDKMHIEPGDPLLEVGCGTGVLSRWLAKKTSGACPITAINQNAYLLREASALARAEGVDDAIEFQEADALELPFDDASQGGVCCFTLLEEVDADAVLQELVRVTMPGKTIGIIVRAADRPWQVNLGVSDAIRAKVDAPMGAVAGNSCADTSLYDRVQNAGLTDLKLFPHMAALTGPMGYYYLDRMEAKLSSEERAEWHTALVAAETNGMLFVAQPFHCAVGTRHA